MVPVVKKDRILEIGYDLGLQGQVIVQDYIEHSGMRGWADSCIKDLDGKIRWGKII